MENDGESGRSGRAFFRSLPSLPSLYYLERQAGQLRHDGGRAQALLALEGQDGLVLAVCGWERA